MMETFVMACIIGLATSAAVACIFYLVKPE